MIDEKLSDLSDRLTGNPHVATIEVPLPDEPAREAFITATTADTPVKDFSDFDAARAGQAHRRHFADRPQRADPVGARERQAPRREGVPRAEEAPDRAAVPGPARVHRAALDARHGRRTRGRQGAAARGRGAAEARRARQPADGLPALRPGRHRQVVPRAVRRRRDRHSLRHAEELPLEVRRRDGRQPRAGAVGAARDGPGGRGRRRSRRRARQPRAGRATPARRAASSR